MNIDTLCSCASESLFLNSVQTRRKISTYKIFRIMMFVALYSVLINAKRKMAIKNIIIY